ncbi:high frequency lysogenization protein HflD [Xenorhabdus szentirmaii]|uniref:High frequency lysogenization protein HflD homolog n=2 Tax=Xenorhabdus szentirmaii TaxID=290112 RepID=W1IW40_9GAMM|nr:MULTISPECIES: high frequency lysogenization protein HflD [Xenorhabdus]MBD2791076.1 high frequency lysogenization protein HflD [Xenorhabdus sp. CUL]MBD2799798.1 high frequency lysogenization protein HflD [Xenorhabdus sp. M]MBD2825296.1 high frequency lysogenization protein HflD [Xenorhabdus sp. 5]PHM32214.1 lysogenization protein HflD [Xenorhabdus szentirmaii DSM 16338]CDL82038.1 High frequency lysogenization protein hflD homolog [Xenorhabdus szentirmaii DSM 16338]
MAKNYYDITLALAGICQSGRLVQTLASEGQCDTEAFETMINSILNMNPTSTLDVFGKNAGNLRIGLDAMLGMFNGSHSGVSADLTRYMLSLMSLERRLNKNPSARGELANRISQLERQQTYFEPMSEGMLNALAGIYVDVISPLGPRIQVTGSPDVLRNSLIQSKVRSTLLAGIRSAVLWQQIGGSRLQIMFSRQRLIQQAKDILAHC